jgi:predicted AAA+ superfamily ATPase
MPHPRRRFLTSVILKRLKFYPVLAMQGARQTGKSFLWKHLLAESLDGLRYESLDDGTLQEIAQRAPGQFLSQRLESQPLVIDEAQKSPALFDAVKLQVDQMRRPGRYVLLGSTEFSRLSRIRESLTGRMGRVRVFPLTLAESLGLNAKNQLTKPPTDADLARYLATGGLPGICFIRSASERELAFQDWLDLVCQRDIYQFKTVRLDSGITQRILAQCALLEEPTAPGIAKTLRLNTKTVLKHLNALCELFVLTRLDPHPSGTGKTHYLPFDVGVAQFLGANPIRLLQIFLLNELLVQDQCQNTKRSEFYHYRSTGKRHLHVIEVHPGRPPIAHQIIDIERVRIIDVQLVKAFLQKNPGSSGRVYAPVRQRIKVDGVSVHPWLDLVMQ